MHSPNLELYNAIHMWYENHYAKVLENFPDEIFSTPFIYGEPTRLFEDPCKVMVIGQEARDFPPSFEKVDLQINQNWTISFLERQVYGIQNSERYLSSPFWDFFRLLYSNCMHPTWNNLDKVHRLVSDGENLHTKPLQLEHEMVLSDVLQNGDSLLVSEVKISQPKAVIFVTGPDYYQSMAKALNCSPKLLFEKKPSRRQIVTEITGLTSDKIPMFWSYHPKYLRMMGDHDKSMLKVIEYVRGKMA